MLNGANTSTIISIFVFNCNTFCGDVGDCILYIKQTEKNGISLNIWSKEKVTSSDFQAFPVVN